MPRPDTTTRDLVLAGLILVVASLVFRLWPQIDITVAGLFRDGPKSFPASRNAALLALRGAGLETTRIITVVLILIGLARIAGLRLAARVPTAEYLFLAATLAIGPGLLVNALLKAWWGRPRPVQSDVLGGDMAFMPAWVPGGACPSNCSFVSGEASSSFWLLAFAFVVPPRFRLWTAIAALVWAVAISLNRIAFGSHYLSDVLIAWALVLIVLLVARRIMLGDGGRAQAAKIDAWLAGARARLVASLAGLRK